MTRWAGARGWGEEGLRGREGKRWACIELSLSIRSTISVYDFNDKGGQTGCGLHGYSPVSVFF